MMRFTEHSMHVEEILTNTMGCTMNMKLQCSVCEKRVITRGKFNKHRVL